MLRIQLESQMAQISLQPAHTKLSLQQTAPQLQLSTQATIVEISGNRSGTLEIDHTATYEALGMRSQESFATYTAQLGQEQYQKFLSRVIDEGNMLLQIENGFTAIYDIAESATIGDPCEVSIGYLPLPSVSFTPNNQLSINVQPGSLNQTLQRGTVTNDTVAAQVNMQMKNYQSLRISTIGTKNFSA